MQIKRMGRFFQIFKELYQKCTFLIDRVADELGMGIRLQPDKHLTIQKVRTAIESILTDPSYREIATKMSLLSQSYHGHLSACEHTVNFIKENEEDQVFYSPASSSPSSYSSMSASSSKASSQCSLNNVAELRKSEINKFVTTTTTTRTTRV